MEMENSNTNEILLSNDGRVFRRSIEQREVVMDEDALFSTLREGQKIKIKDAFFVRNLPTGLCIVTGKTSKTEVWATISLPFIRFNTAFKSVEDWMVPVFGMPDTSKPRFNVDWDVNAGCNGKIKLWFMVRTYSEAGVKDHAIDTCYLVATSNTNKLYRIPLANVYDDCKVCMGKFNLVYPTLAQALDAALEQLLSSPWNSDLKKDPEKSDAFFRLKLKNDGCETLSCTGQWNNLCERVSVPALDNLCLPLVEGGENEIF